MSSVFLGAWLGWCVIMIRNADGLPLWADVTLTALGLFGIICAVVMNREPTTEGGE